MRTSDLLATLRSLGQPYFQTRDAAAAAKISTAYANMALKRLAAQGLLIHLTQGRWAFPGIAPMVAAQAVSTPFPMYVSFFSALYHHGLIEQIPSVVYAATLGRSRRVATPVATISLHHLTPAFFIGFDASAAPAPMASPEKALVDTLYLFPARSQLFRSLPEIEFPRSFRWTAAHRFAQAIPGQSRKSMVLTRLQALKARKNTEAA